MCGRYVVVSKLSEIEKRFDAVVPFDFPPVYNLGPGSRVPVITSDQPGEAQLFVFGLTPFWAEKRMYFFNARAEGDHNKENDPAYRGVQGIVDKPAFRKPVRSRRCLIIADAFIEGTTREKLDKPFLVHLGKGKRPFAFAGIWDEWTDRDTGEIVHSCAIITTVANSLLQEIPHHRSPVILRREDEARWLNPDLPLHEVTAMLKPCEEGDMNAYPIDKAVKHPRASGPELIAPAGPPLRSDDAFKIDGDN